MDDTLIIDWAQIPMYNTIMSLAAGAGLLSIVWLGWSLQRGKVVSFEGAAANFLALGLILTITGAHLTLTWPLSGIAPYDNIIFGEPSLAFGVLLLVGSLLLWRRRNSEQDEARVTLARVVHPLSILIIGLGLALGAIAFAGLIFQLFAAPPQEPISGAFAQWPWVEAIFMSGLFGVTGIGAVLFPFAASNLSRGTRRTPIQWMAGIALGLPGLGFLLFGALNFFTHIGLIINTMGS